jgi:hypothetical protein
MTYYLVTLINWYTAWLTKQATCRLCNNLCYFQFWSDLQFFTHLCTFSIIPEHTARNTWPKPKVPGSTFKTDAFCSGTWRSPSKVGTTCNDDTAESCSPRPITVSHILAVKFNNTYIWGKQCNTCKRQATYSFPHGKHLFLMLLYHSWTNSANHNFQTPPLQIPSFTKSSKIYLFPKSLSCTTFYTLPDTSFIWLIFCN